jgi:hypothetical protein
MGNLLEFDLKSFNCDVFIETGTGGGHSLKFAYESKVFSKLYSIEIHYPTFLKVFKKFNKCKNVEIINADSVCGLKTFLSEINNHSKILFFLDAHFPGSYFPGYDGDLKIEPIDLKLPLQHELNLIKKMRPDSFDTIIIDDLRIYEDGPFEKGNIPGWPSPLNQINRTIDFVYELFPKRKITKNFKDEGYIFIEPIQC